MDDTPSRSHTVTLSPDMAGAREVRAVRAGVTPSDVLARMFEAQVMSDALTKQPSSDAAWLARLRYAFRDFWDHLVSDSKMIHPSEETRRMSTHR